MHELLSLVFVRKQSAAHIRKTPHLLGPMNVSLTGADQLIIAWYFSTRWKSAYSPTESEDPPKFFKVFRGPWMSSEMILMLTHSSRLTGDLSVTWLPAGEGSVIHSTHTPWDWQTVYSTACMIKDIHVSITCWNCPGPQISHVSIFDTIIVKTDSCCPSRSGLILYQGQSWGAAGQIHYEGWAAAHSSQVCW